MELVRALHRLAVLASFRPPPEDLARALCVQVLRDFEVSFVQLLRLASRGQWIPIASFGDLDALARLTGDGTATALDSIDLLVGEPTAYDWSDLRPQHAAANDEQAATYLLCLPLMARGLLRGSLMIGMDVDPSLRRHAEFWETIAIACASLMSPPGAPNLPSPDPSPSGADNSLTDRQLAILDLVAEGLTNLQIGNRLGYSESTIGHDLVLAYERLGVRNREDAVLAIQRGRGTPQSSGAVA